MKRETEVLRQVGKVSAAGRVRYGFLFDNVAVLVGQWMEQAEDGPEVGARVQVHRLTEDMVGGEFAARPIHLTDPIWRGDFFTFLPGSPGNHDRAHFHATFNGVQPSERQWDDALKADPVRWLEREFSDGFADILRAGGATDLVAGPDPEQVRAELPAILEAVRRCLRVEPESVPSISWEFVPD